jgi:signal transduction histidine kinase
MIDAFIYVTDFDRVGLIWVAALFCVLAAYTAFSLSVKPAPAEKVRYPWLIAAGVAVGSGAWAANLILLLGHRTDVQFAFALLPMVLALIVGIVGSGTGLLLARNKDQMPLGGTIIGLSIAAMFFLGMSGVHFTATKSWDPLYVAASVALGAGCGAAALLRGHLSPNIRGRLISTVILAFGMMGTQLFGLTALTLNPDPNITVAADSSVIILFGISLTAVVMLIIGLGLVGALADRYVGEIEEANSRLEERVAERTAELSVAKEQAEAAALAKSEFLASMSHELRTPLNAVLGFSDMISNAAIGPIDPRYRDYGIDIHTAGEHLLSLVNDVLDLSKLESGKFDLHQEEVDLAELIVGCRSMVIGLAREAGVKLKFDLCWDSSLVWADPLRIKQIVVNLLSNAIKFTGPDGLVTVSTSVDREGKTVIAVRDNGIGMHEEDLDKALEPFGQIDNAWNRKHSGTGLGLPVVKHLAELHGGNLSIISERGVGTIVQVTLSTPSVSKLAAAS